MAEYVLITTFPISTMYVPIGTYAINSVSNCESVK